MASSVARGRGGAIPLLIALLVLPLPPSRADYTLAFLSDLHVGEGCPVPYNGEEDCYSVQYLKTAVAHLNDVLVPSLNLSAVLVSGDLTSSSYPTQWPKVRALLDNLTVPYLPAIGNHDIWPYDKENGTWTTPSPTGDLSFADTFADLFARLSAPTSSSTSSSSFRVTNYTNHTLSWNAAHNCTSAFQNFEAVFTDPSTGDRALWLAPDFNTRDKAWDPTERGVMGYAERGLSDFPGGTLQWLDERLALAAAATAPPVSRIYLLHHQPYSCPFYVPDALFCFGVADKVLLQTVLARHFPLDVYWGAFTGHTHLFQGPTLPFPDWISFLQFETSAVKGDALFPGNLTASITTVVFGAGANVTGITEHWHDPTTGTWGTDVVMEGGVWLTTGRRGEMGGRAAEELEERLRGMTEEEQVRLVKGMC
jgi:hypothetical protein